MPTRGSLLLALLPGAALLLGAAPLAAQEGFRLRPSLSVAEVYDDNLFFTPPPRQTDTITRVSPGLDVGYRSATSTLAGRYTFDAESFASHPALSATLARQEAVLEAGYAPGGPWLASATGTYTETHTPGELNVTTALEPGRVRAERLAADAAFSWRFGPRTEALARYAFSRDSLALGPRGDTHIATASLERRLSPHDGLTVAYSLRRYAFARSDEARAHVVTLSWAHDLDPQTQLKLGGGPRLGDGKTEPEIEASLRRRWPRGDLALAYTQGQSRIVGQPGVASTEMVSLNLGQNLARTLRVSLSPGVFRARLLGSAATVYRWSVDIDWKLSRWLALDASQVLSRQRGSLLGGAEIAHNLLLLRLVAAPPAPPSSLRRPGLGTEGDAP